MKIILGSSSRWRAQILKDAGYKLTAMHPDIDEQAIRDPDPEKLTLALANAKADKLLSQINEDAILITSDQVVACNGNIFEKPRSAEEASFYMQSYANYPAKTVTAVVVVNTKNNKRVSGLDIVEIEFWPIPKEVIDKLIAEGHIFSCAGGFQIEAEDHSINPYIKSFNGDIDSVKGLPLKLLAKLINQLS